MSDASRNSPKRGSHCSVSFRSFIEPSRECPRIGFGQLSLILFNIRVDGPPKGQLVSEAS
jgi:hypothetical protein